jgi:hypothetical protein
MDQLLITIAIVGIIFSVIFTMNNDRKNRNNIKDALSAKNQKIISIKRTSNNIIFIDFRYKLEIEDKNGNRRWRECTIGSSKKIEWINEK